MNDCQPWEHSAIKRDAFVFALATERLPACMDRETYMDSDGYVLLVRNCKRCHSTLALRIEDAGQERKAA